MINNRVARKFEIEAARHIGERLYRLGGVEPISDPRQVVSRSISPGSYRLLTIERGLIWLKKNNEAGVARCVRPEFFYHQFGINLPYVLEKLIREDKEEQRGQMSLRDLPDPVSLDELIAMIRAQPDSAFA